MVVKTAQDAVFLNFCCVYWSAEQTITATPAEAAIAEHIGHKAGEAGIAADGGTEIITAAAGLAICLAAGLNGIQQGLEIRIIGGHPHGCAGMIQG